MTVQNRANLAARATQIRNETAGFANSEVRVGSLLQDMVDSTAIMQDITSYGVLTTNSGAENDVAAAAAIVSATAAGADLYWPQGTYPSAGNILGLHTIRHRGPGKIQRGSDVFCVEPNYLQSNTIYIAPTGGGGSSNNDGISSTVPRDRESIAALLGNYGPMLNGTWNVVGAAGTYAAVNQVTLDGLKSLNPIVFRGPAVAYGTPTMIVDGAATLNGICGYYFRNGVRVTMRDMKLVNFTSTDAMGVTADRHCELWCDNVHTTGNNLAGINAESHTRLYVTAGIHTANVFYNIRAYGQCLVSIGYSSSAHRVTVGDATHAGGSGILIRDSSSGHVDYCDISSVHDGGGVELLNDTRVALVSNIFGGAGANLYNLKLAACCTFIDEGGNTFNAATARNAAQWGWSLDNASIQKVYYDLTTGFFRIGNQTDNLIPGAPMHFLHAAQAGVTNNYNTNTVVAIESATPYLSFGASAASSAGFFFTKNASNRQGQIDYTFGNDTFLMRAGNVDAFKWFSGNGSPGGYYRPEVTGANAPDLGDATHGWRGVFVGTASPAQMRSGTGSPAGVVTGNPGDIWLRTDGGAGTTLYVKESGVGTTGGWAAK